MEKVKINRFFWIWSIAGLFATILIWNLPWRFQVNDDEIMMWLVSGAYTGTPESYAVFIHPLLSWIFSQLYSIAPNIKWYPLTWFLVLFLAYELFLFLIVEKFKSHWTKIIWSLFLFGLFTHFLFFLQFSIVAAFSLAAGLAFRLAFSKSNSNGWNSIYPSDILILAGILIRQEVAFLFLIGILVLNAQVIKDKQIYRLIIFPAVALLLTFFSSQFLIDQEFQKINQFRSAVFDHPVLQLNKVDFKESEPELYFFSNGLIDFKKDQELSEKLLNWRDFLDEQRVSYLSFSFINQALYTYIEHEIYLISIIALFILFSFTWKIKKQFFLLSILVAIVLFLAPFYLIKVQIYVIVFLVYFLISFINSPTILDNPKYSAGFGVVLIAGIIFHFYSFTKSYENFPSTKNLELQITKLKEEGIDEIILIGSGEVYHDLIFQNPLPFKVLGWPTLLDRSRPIEKKRAYLVDSVTYSKNSPYFKEETLLPSICDQVLLISKE